MDERSRDLEYTELSLLADCSLKTKVESARIEVYVCVLV
jgi:hypothetical protein